MSIVYIENIFLTRLRFYAIFDFTNYANHDFRNQMSSFKSRNIRDSQYDFRVHKTIPGFRENVLIYNQEKGELPWYVKTGFYYFLLVFMLSWVQRIFFSKNSTKVKFNISKLIL